MKDFDYQDNGNVIQVFDNSNSMEVIAVCKDTEKASLIVDALNHECEKLDEDEIIEELFSS